MKILITAGGGGHFAPALAVIQRLPEDWEYKIVGRKYAFEGDKALSLEYQTAQKENLSFVSLTTGRLQRKFTRYTLFSLCKIPYGFFQAFGILRKYKPYVVLSFGGYISLPITIAAFLLRVPVVIHEQTLEAGAANLFAARFAKKICISWEESAHFFPKEKIVLTGNPIREFQISSIRQAQNKNFKFQISNESLPLIYITGGSLGAHAINGLVKHSLQELLGNYRVIHQTGDAKNFHDFDDLSRIKNGLPEKLRERYIVVKFVEPENVGVLLERADLVVARSGINTVSELIYFKKLALLIPLPFSQKDEQLKNAMFFQHLGLGVFVEQTDLDAKKFIKNIVEIVKHEDEYQKRAKNLKDILPTNAAEKIIDVIAHV